ncbi:alpha-glucosidase [Halobacteriaceae archaeon SHR40]|uniref:alpha-glucosidase n=1 Tax=Halovenus amylolytica TaxID=2500550 RepID=UPI000FE3B643
MDESTTTGVVPEERSWWKEAVFYQIYPRSFNDSDGDGIGDIQGIIEKVPHLDDLGVDAVWLNPVYESPQADIGYDISDYRAINPEYGSMEAWDELLSTLHDHDIRLIMDLVVNHTSEEHNWFKQSRTETGKYADYYYWQSSERGYPNNWESHFDTPAWSFDETREEYYLHLFASEQPDLNWTNPDVREEVFDIVDWWLDRGIDGFRMDVINVISKAAGLPDGDPDSDHIGAEHFVNGPEMHDYLNELNEQGFGSYRDEMVAVGECAQIDPETAIDVTGRKSGAIDITIYFEHMEMDREDGWEYREWELPELKSIMSKWQDAVEKGTWICLYHSNHDQPRGISRFGDPEAYRYESATMLATWLHGHKGSPFVYQGEEIGMSNVTFESPDALDDVWAENHWENEQKAGKEFEEVRPDFERFGRDNARTPVQWSDDDHAGFSTARPWLDVGDDYASLSEPSSSRRQAPSL